MQSRPQTLNRAAVALPVGQGWEAMSARRRASDLGNLLCWGTLLLVHKSIGFMSMPLDEHGAGEVLRAVNRLFNSPGHRPGGRRFFPIPPFLLFSSLLSFYCPLTLTPLQSMRLFSVDECLQERCLEGLRECVCINVCKEERFLAIEDVRCSVLQYCLY